MPWSQNILVASALLQTVALKIESGDLPTHPTPSSTHQQGTKVPGVAEISEIFSVTTTSRCIVIICCQFMVVYAALAACRMHHEFTATAKGRLEAALRAAAQTLTYGPMVCALFIACQMRVQALSNGTEEPQIWVQHCMYALTFGVMASTALVLVIQLLTGKPLASKKNPFDIERQQVDKTCSKTTFYTLSTMRYLVLFAMYGALVGVIVGICSYLPSGSKKLSNIETPAPAVMCTMILAVAFFSTQLIVAGCRTCSELARVDFPRVVGIMHAAALTVEFAPMLAVLFLAAHMRASQHGTQPQEWAQNLMFASTGAMCVTTLLSILVPLTLGGTLKTNPWTHETIVEVPKPTLGVVFIVLRYVCMLCFYGGAVGVSISIVVFKAPGLVPTLPVSAAIQCVVNLTCQFFFVYFLMTVMLTVSEMTGGTMPMEKWSLFPAIEGARSTLAFAPMLSIIFVTTRMHALLITHNEGASPSWVQDGMYLATWSLQMSGMMCLVTGLIMPKVEIDHNGYEVNKFSNRFIGIVAIAIRYIAMLFLFCGMAMVIIGLFKMTPENANGYGSMPHVADANNVTPVVVRPSW